MNEEKRRILDMLAEGKINTEEAEKLLDALGENSTRSTEKPDKSDSADKRKPKYLHVQIEEGGNHTRQEIVNVKVPILLLKTGMKLKSFLPKEIRGKISGHLHEHGLHFDLDNMNTRDLDELMVALAETSIDVESNNEKIRIFCS